MSEEDFAILRGLYDGEISYVDSRIGQLYNWLQEAGLLCNTLLIITSDHGENLGEHQLMDHAYCLYDTLLRVPFVVYFPIFRMPLRRENHHAGTDGGFLTHDHGHGRGARRGIVESGAGTDPLPYRSPGSDRALGCRRIYRAATAVTGVKESVLRV